MLKADLSDIYPCWKDESGAGRQEARKYPHRDSAAQREETRVLGDQKEAHTTTGLWVIWGLGQGSRKGRDLARHGQELSLWGRQCLWEEVVFTAKILAERGGDASLECVRVCSLPAHWMQGVMVNTNESPLLP